MVDDEIRTPDEVVFEKKMQMNIFLIKESPWFWCFKIYKDRPTTYIDDAILVAVEETPEEVGQLLQLEGRQLLLEGGVVHSTPIWTQENNWKRYVM